MSQTDTNGTSVTVPLVGVNQVRDSRTSPMIDDIGGQTQEFLIDKSVRDLLRDCSRYECQRPPDHVKDTLDPRMGTLFFNKTTDSVTPTTTNLTVRIEVHGVPMSHDRVRRMSRP